MTRCQQRINSSAVRLGFCNALEPLYSMPADYSGKSGFVEIMADGVNVKDTAETVREEDK